MRRDHVASAGGPWAPEGVMCAFRPLARLSPPHNLPRRWASRSVDEAIETLASPDVTVTNQSDKELQLYKLRELDSLVQEAVAQCAREAVDPTVVEIAPPSRG